MQLLLRRYNEIEYVVKAWQKQRVFETAGIRKIVGSLQVFLEAEKLMRKVQIDKGQYECEIKSSFMKI